MGPPLPEFVGVLYLSFLRIGLRLSFFFFSFFEGYWRKRRVRIPLGAWGMEVFVFCRFDGGVV